MKPVLGAIQQTLYCNSVNGWRDLQATPVEANAGMKWFRSNIRLGSRLALFALAIQFVLSFGHFHGSAAQAASEDAMQSRLHATVRLAATQAEASDTSRHEGVTRAVRLRIPTDHGPNGQPADDCAICAVMALANAMAVATPPYLLAPQAVALRYLPGVAEFVDRNAARVAFQPRAPPIC